MEVESAAKFAERLDLNLRFGDCDIGSFRLGHPPRNADGNAVVGNAEHRGPNSEFCTPVNRKRLSHQRVEWIVDGNRAMTVCGM